MLKKRSLQGEIKTTENTFLMKVYTLIQVFAHFLYWHKEILTNVYVYKACQRVNDVTLRPLTAWRQYYFAATVQNLQEP